jgi:hypothetical protein
VPVSFLMQFLSLYNKSPTLFLWTPFITACVAAITVLVWGTIYIHLRFSKKLIYTKLSAVS